MRRYAPSLVLACWALFAAAGCTWSVPWMVLLAGGVVLWAVESLSSGRRRRR